MSLSNCVLDATNANWENFTTDSGGSLVAIRSHDGKAVLGVTFGPADNAFYIIVNFASHEFLYENAEILSIQARFDDNPWVSIPVIVVVPEVDGEILFMTLPPSLEYQALMRSFIQRLREDATVQIKLPEGENEVGGYTYEFLLTDSVKAIDYFLRKCNHGNWTDS